MKVPGGNDDGTDASAFVYYKNEVRSFCFGALCEEFIPGAIAGGATQGQLMVDGGKVIYNGKTYTVEISGDYNSGGYINLIAPKQDAIEGVFDIEDYKRLDFFSLQEKKVGLVRELGLLLEEAKALDSQIEYEHQKQIDLAKRYRDAFNTLGKYDPETTKRLGQWEAQRRLMNQLYIKRYGEFEPTRAGPGIPLILEDPFDSTIQHTSFLNDGPIVSNTLYDPATVSSSDSYLMWKINEPASFEFYRDISKDISITGGNEIDCSHADWVDLCDSPTNPVTSVQRNIDHIFEALEAIDDPSSPLNVAGVFSSAVDCSGPPPVAGCNGGQMQYALERYLGAIESLGGWERDPATGKRKEYLDHMAGTPVTGPTGTTTLLTDPTAVSKTWEQLRDSDNFGSINVDTWAMAQAKLAGFSTPYERLFGNQTNPLKPLCPEYTKYDSCQMRNVLGDLEFDASNQPIYMMSEVAGHAVATDTDGDGVMDTWEPIDCETTTCDWTNQSQGQAAREIAWLEAYQKEAEILEIQFRREKLETAIDSVNAQIDEMIAAKLSIEQEIQSILRSEQRTSLEYTSDAAYEAGSIGSAINFYIDPNDYTDGLLPLGATGWDDIPPYFYGKTFTADNAHFYMDTELDSRAFTLMSLIKPETTAGGKVPNQAGVIYQTLEALKKMKADYAALYSDMYLGWAADETRYDASGAPVERADTGYLSGYDLQKDWNKDGCVDGGAAVSCATKWETEWHFTDPDADVTVTSAGTYPSSSSSALSVEEEQTYRELDAALVKANAAQYVNVPDMTRMNNDFSALNPANGLSVKVAEARREERKSQVRLEIEEIINENLKKDQDRLEAIEKNLLVTRDTITDELKILYLELIHAKEQAEELKTFVNPKFVYTCSPSLGTPAASCHYNSSTSDPLDPEKISAGTTQILRYQLSQEFGFDMFELDAGYNTAREAMMAQLCGVGELECPSFDDLILSGSGMLMELFASLEALRAADTQAFLSATESMKSLMGFVRADTSITPPTEQTISSSNPELNGVVMNWGEEYACGATATCSRWDFPTLVQYELARFMVDYQKYYMQTMTDTTTVDYARAELRLSSLAHERQSFETEYLRQKDQIQSVRGDMLAKREELLGLHTPAEDINGDGIPEADYDNDGVIDPEFSVYDLLATTSDDEYSKVAGVKRGKIDEIEYQMMRLGKPNLAPDNNIYNYPYEDPAKFKLNWLENILDEVQYRLRGGAPAPSAPMGVGGPAPPSTRPEALDDSSKETQTLAQWWSDGSGSIDSEAVQEIAVLIVPVAINPATAPGTYDPNAEFPSLYPPTNLTDALYTSVSLTLPKGVNQRREYLKDLDQLYVIGVGGDWAGSTFRVIGIESKYLRASLNRDRAEYNESIFNYNPNSNDNNLAAWSRDGGTPSQAALHVIGLAQKAQRDERKIGHITENVTELAEILLEQSRTVQALQAAAAVGLAHARAFEGIGGINSESLRRVFNSLSTPELNIEHLFDRSKGFSDVANALAGMFTDAKLVKNSSVAQVLTDLVDYAAQEIATAGMFLQDMVSGVLSHSEALYEAFTVRFDPNFFNYVDAQQKFNRAVEEEILAEKAYQDARNKLTQHLKELARDRNDLKARLDMFAVLYEQAEVDVAEYEDQIAVFNVERENLLDEIIPARADLVASENLVRLMEGEYMTALGEFQQAKVEFAEDPTPANEAALAIAWDAVTSAVEMLESARNELHRDQAVLASLENQVYLTRDFSYLELEAKLQQARGVKEQTKAMFDSLAIDYEQAREAALLLDDLGNEIDTLSYFGLAIDAIDLAGDQDLLRNVPAAMVQKVGVRASYDVAGNLQYLPVYAKSQRAILMEELQAALNNLDQISGRRELWETRYKTLSGITDQIDDGEQTTLSEMGMIAHLNELSHSYVEFFKGVEHVQYLEKQAQTSHVLLDTVGDMAETETGDIQRMAKRVRDEQVSLLQSLEKEIRSYINPFPDTTGMTVPELDAVVADWEPGTLQRILDRVSRITAGQPRGTVIGGMTLPASLEHSYEFDLPPTGTYVLENIEKRNEALYERIAGTDSFDRVAEEPVTENRDIVTETMFHAKGIYQKLLGNIQVSQTRLLLNAIDRILLEYPAVTLTPVDDVNRRFMPIEEVITHFDVAGGYYELAAHYLDTLTTETSFEEARRILLRIQEMRDAALLAASTALDQDEDTNGNGILDAGEDVNGNSRLDIGLDAEYHRIVNVLIPATEDARTLELLVRKSERVFRKINEMQEVLAFFDYFNNDDQNGNLAEYIYDAYSRFTEFKQDIITTRELQTELTASTLDNSKDAELLQITRDQIASVISLEADLGNMDFAFDQVLEAREFLDVSVIGEMTTVAGLLRAGLEDSQGFVDYFTAHAQQFGDKQSGSLRLTETYELLPREGVWLPEKTSQTDYFADSFGSQVARIVRFDRDELADTSYYWYDGFGNLKHVDVMEGDSFNISSRIYYQDPANTEATRISPNPIRTDTFVEPIAARLDLVDDPSLLESSNIASSTFNYNNDDGSMNQTQAISYTWVDTSFGEEKRASLTDSRYSGQLNHEKVGFVRQYTNLDFETFVGDVPDHEDATLVPGLDGPMPGADYVLHPSELRSEQRFYYENPLFAEYPDPLNPGDDIWLSEIDDGSGDPVVDLDGSGGLSAPVEDPFWMFFDPAAGGVYPDFDWDDSLSLPDSEDMDVMGQMTYFDDGTIQKSINIYSGQENSEVPVATIRMRRYNPELCVPISVCPEAFHVEAITVSGYDEKGALRIQSVLRATDYDTPIFFAQAVDLIQGVNPFGGGDDFLDFETILDEGFIVESLSYYEGARGTERVRQILQYSQHDPTLLDIAIEDVLDELELAAPSTSVSGTLDEVAASSSGSYVLPFEIGETLTLSSFTSYFYHENGDVDYTITNRYPIHDVRVSETVKTIYDYVGGEQRIASIIEDDTIVHEYAYVQATESIVFDWLSGFDPITGAPIPQPFTLTTMLAGRPERFECIPSTVDDTCAFTSIPGGYSGTFIDGEYYEFNGDRYLIHIRRDGNMGTLTLSWDEELTVARTSNSLVQEDGVIQNQVIESQNVTNQLLQTMNNPFFQSDSGHASTFTDSNGQRIRSVDRFGNVTHYYYRHDPVTGELSRDPETDQPTETYVVESNGNITILGAEGERIALIDYEGLMPRGNPADKTGIYREVSYWNAESQTQEQVSLNDFMNDDMRFLLQFLARPETPAGTSDWFWNDSAYDPSVTWFEAIGLAAMDFNPYPLLQQSDYLETLQPSIHWYDYARDSETGKILRDAFGQPIQMIESFESREIDPFGTKMGSGYQDVMSTLYYHEGSLVGQDTEVRDPLVEAGIAAGDPTYLEYKKYNHVRIRPDGTFEMVQNSHEEEQEDIAVGGDATYRNNHALRISFDTETGVVQDASLSNADGGAYIPLLQGTFDFESVLLDEQTLYVKRSRGGGAGGSYQPEVGLLYKKKVFPKATPVYPFSPDHPANFFSKWTLYKVYNETTGEIRMPATTGTDPFGLNTYNRIFQAGAISTIPLPLGVTSAGVPYYAEPADLMTDPAALGASFNQFVPFSSYLKTPQSTYDKYFIEQRNRAQFLTAGGVSYESLYRGSTSGLPDFGDPYSVPPRLFYDKEPNPNTAVANWETSPGSSWLDPTTGSLLNTTGTQRNKLTGEIFEYMIQQTDGEMNPLLRLDFNDPVHRGMLDNIYNTNVMWYSVLNPGLSQTIGRNTDLRVIEFPDIGDIYEHGGSSTIMTPSDREMARINQEEYAPPLEVQKEIISREIAWLAENLEKQRFELNEFFWGNPTDGNIYDGFTDTMPVTNGQLDYQPGETNLIGMLLERLRAAEQQTDRGGLEVRYDWKFLDQMDELIRTDALSEIEDVYYTRVLKTGVMMSGIQV